MVSILKMSVLSIFYVQFRIDKHFIYIVWCSHWYILRNYQDLHWTWTYRKIVMHSWKIIDDFSWDEKTESSCLHKLDTSSSTGFPLFTSEKEMRKIKLSRSTLWQGKTVFVNLFAFTEFIVSKLWIIKGASVLSQKDIRAHIWGNSKMKIFNG